MSKISVIVTNWNGLSLLKKYLHHVCENSPEASEILFADDASEDASLKYVSELQKKYPRLKIISHRKNLGFGKNTNHAVSKASGSHIVLLNSDILPHPGYISSSLKLFKDPALFGVSFSESNNENWSKLFWSEGYLQYKRGEPTRSPHVSGWVSGGGSLIDREKYLKLGGFDDIYAPFYSEDVDLGYRAWKSGYNLLWNPKSIIEHKHESTMSKFPRRFLDYVKERNRLLTVWRNITDTTMLRQNRFAIIGRVLTGPNYIKIIRAAKRQVNSFPLPIVFPVRSDKDIFSLFK